VFKVPEKDRIKTGIGDWNSTEADGNNGAFLVEFRRDPFKPVMMQIIASDGLGWEHVSVKALNVKRCPTWDEMCFVKDLFWDSEDVVMQLHPARSEYVNFHPNVLHLWRPTCATIPVPPSIMVGPIR